MWQSLTIIGAYYRTPLNHHFLTLDAYSVYMMASFNPLDSYIWFELYGSPSDRDVDLLGSVRMFLFHYSYSTNFYLIDHLNFWKKRGKKVLIFCIWLSLVQDAILTELFDKHGFLMWQVIQSWYVMGRLGAFNSSNLQVCFYYVIGISPFIIVLIWVVL